MRSSKPEEILGASERSWHAMPADEVLSALGSRRGGLSEEEVAKRKGEHGLNRFSKKKSKTVFGRIFDQFKSPLTVILLVAGLVTLGLEEYIDAAVIGLALLIAVVVGVVQEGRASRAFDKLASSQVHTAVVMRGGKRHEIQSEEVVPGDVVMLQSGGQVPADMRLFEAKQLSVNEAALTGEWAAVDKTVEPVDVGVAFAERGSMAWKGTFIAEGHGLGVVVATGDNTEVGKLAGELSDVVEEETPLQSEMKRISRIMFAIIVALVSVIFVIGLLRGEALETMLVMSIAIAVASVPEGLPAAVTIVLAIGMEALLKRGGLVRSLLAAETLGSTTYILTDKTGTLTEGRMAVVDVVGADRTMMLEMALAASDAFVDENEKSTSFVVRGEPMEKAILEACLKEQILPNKESMRARRTDYLSFTSENRFAAGLSTYDGNGRLAINGAPEYVLEASDRVYKDGGAKQMDGDTRQEFLEDIDQLTKEGKRIIAVGYRDVPWKEIPEDTSEMLREVVFLGLLVFHDPVRAGVAEAIRGVQLAGAQVRLVTGDNPETALSVARAVRIARKHDVALVGKDIASFTDEELVEVLQTTHVFARVLPRQKLRLAQVLQRKGEIVAMTGDGINDAPALQKANIGVALGSGTAVAKEASDLVLVKDTFATIHAAIEEGRRIIGNLQKIVGYLLSTSLSEAVLIGGALIVGAPVPIVPVQILWANIIEEGFMSVAFAFERGDKNAMKERPHDIREEGILSRELMLFIGMLVVILSAFLIALYAFLLYLEMPLGELRSVMFMAIAIDSLFIAFSFRSLRTPIWKIPLRTNLFFLGSFAVSAAALMLVIFVPPMHILLSYEPLPVGDILLIAAYGLCSLLAIEVGKWIFFERRRAA